MSQLKNSNLKTANGKGRLRVLHVDDDPSILEVSKSILELEGNFEVDDASSVDEALKKLVEQAYDMVVSDYEMPNKNGLDLLRTLREQKNMIPFALFTGKGREDVAMTALNLGADGYFNKQGSTETVYGELAHGIKQSVERKHSAENLLKNKALLSETEKTGKIGGWEFDVNTLTQTWTEETFHILGIDLSHGEPTVPKGIEFINPEYRSMANEAIKRAIEHGEPYDQKWEITTMKGNKRWVHAVAKANRENNKIRSISGSFQDITESKHTEEKLRQSEERFWQLFSSMPSGVSVYEAVDDGENFVFRDYNAAAEKIDRISRNKVVGKRVTQTFPGVKGFGLLEVFQRVWRTGQMEYFPAALYKDKRDPGSWRENWVYKLPNGNIVAVFNDITEHKKTEAEVLWLASFPALNPNPIVEVDLEGNISYVNSATERFFPDLKKEGLGHPFFSGWQQVVAAFKDGEQQTFSRDIEVGDVWFNQQIQFVHETRHVRIYATNITAAKKAEQETLQTKQLLEAHITNSPLAVIEFDSLYRVTRWSSEAENVFGWSADEVVGKALNEVPWVYKEDVKIVEELSTNMVEGKRPRNMNCNRNYRKDGSVIWCEWYNSAIYDKQGKMVSVLSRVLDITKRKKVEAELREQELKYYNIFNNSEVGMFRTWLDGSEILDFNDKYLSILGINREDIKGRSSVIFWADPLERQEVVRLLKANGQVKDFECKLLNKRHEIIQCLTSVRLYSEQGILEGSIIDITERKKAEEELSRMFDQLVLVNEKLGVVGKLTRHDVRNKLSALTGYAYLLKKKHADQADVVESLGKMEQTIKEVGAIFDFAKLYEQLGVEELTYVDVGKAVDEASTLFPDLIVKVTNDCHGLVVLADSFLRQLFYNLIDNTRKYGKKTTTINIYYEKAESGELRLIYEDDGVGISAENKLKLFHESFSTGGSTGFGLYLIKKMVKVYGWNIAEEGKQGKGAKFTIIIPKLNKNGKENYQIKP